MIFPPPVRGAFDEFQPEIVFHLAAQAIVRTSYDEPKLTVDTNLGGTVNMLEAVRATPSVRTAIFITSDKCYENVEWEFGYRETDRLGEGDRRPREHLESDDVGEHAGGDGDGDGGERGSHGRDATSGAGGVAATTGDGRRRSRPAAPRS